MLHNNESGVPTQLAQSDCNVPSEPSTIDFADRSITRPTANEEWLIDFDPSFGNCTDSQQSCNSHQNAATHENWSDNLRTFIDWNTNADSTKQSPDLMCNSHVQSQQDHCCNSHDTATAMQNQSDEIQISDPYGPEPVDDETRVSMDNEPLEFISFRSPSSEIKVNHQISQVIRHKRINSNLIYEVRFTESNREPAWLPASAVPKRLTAAYWVQNFMKKLAKKPIDQDPLQT